MWRYDDALFTVPVTDGFTFDNNVQSSVSARSEMSALELVTISFQFSANNFEMAPFHRSNWLAICAEGRRQLANTEHQNTTNPIGDQQKNNV